MYVWLANATWEAYLICAARIVESVPDLDAKFYAATQTMDEARHAELRHAGRGQARRVRPDGAA